MTVHDSKHYTVTAGLPDHNHPGMVNYVVSLKKHPASCIFSVRFTNATKLPTIRRQIRREIANALRQCRSLAKENHT